MLHDILTLVVDSIGGVFAGFLLLRFWMQVQRVRPPAQLAQAIFQLTDWLIHPIRRVVPGFRGYDWASLIAVVLVALITVTIDYWGALLVAPLKIMLFSFMQVVQWCIYSLIVLLILEAVFSWVNPSAPLAPFIRALNDPLLTPVRRLIPAIGGLDFSPLIVLIVLQVANRLLAGLFISFLALV